MTAAQGPNCHHCSPWIVYFYATCLWYICVCKIGDRVTLSSDTYTSGMHIAENLWLVLLFLMSCTMLDQWSGVDGVRARKHGVALAPYSEDTETGPGAHKFESSVQTFSDNPTQTGERTLVLP